MKPMLKHLCFAVAATAGSAAFADMAFSEAKWKEGTDGSFHDGTMWDGGAVPSKTADAVVNGYIFNKESDYAVYLDKSATLNFLYVGEDKGYSGPGKVTFVVTNDLVMSSLTNGWTGYRPEYGDSNAMLRRSLELKGPLAEVAVRDGATLTLRPEITDNTWRNSAIGKVSDGARLYVTNATLALDTLRNSSYGNVHLHFDVVGAQDATSVVEVVDGSVNYTGDQDPLDYGNPWKFKEYSRGIFTDTVLDMNVMWDLRTSSADKPVPEILLNGNTVYKWKNASHASITSFNGGHVVFDDDACFTNALPGSGWSKMYIGPEADHASMHLELLGNSTFTADGTWKSDGFFLGAGNSAFRDTATRMTIDTTGEFRAWTSLNIGYRSGVGHLEVKKGTVRMGGYGDIYLGATDSNANHDNQCVTGRLDVSGGVLDINTSSKQNVRGLVVGGAYKLRSADSTDYYSYGEVNITGGSVSNRSDVWVGTGLAKGVFRQSAGEFISDNHTVIGAGGGDGEMHILGGTYSILDAWSKPGTLEGHGSVYIGGVSSERLSVISRFKDMPANFPYDRSGNGYLCVSNASFFVGTYGVNVGTDIGSCGTGLLELKNGATYSTAYMAMTNGSNSRLKFTLSGDDAPQLTVREQLMIGPGAKLTVDARGYTGTARWIQLVKFARGNYPNQYYQGWGFSRNGKPSDWTVSDEVCDLFDEDCIETFGNVEILQVKDNPDGTGRAAGVWAHVWHGFSVTIR